MKNQPLRRFMQKKIRRLLKARLRRKKKKLAQKNQPVINQIAMENTATPIEPLKSSWTEISSRLKMAKEGSTK
jgi:hypothetical protein